MAKRTMVICLGSSCYARGNSANLETAQRFMKERGLTDEVDLDLSGSLCSENCSDGPVVVVDGRIYRHVDAGAMRDLLKSLFPDGAKGETP